MALVAERVDEHEGGDHEQRTGTHRPISAAAVIGSCARSMSTLLSSYAVTW